MILTLSLRLWEHWNLNIFIVMTNFLIDTIILILNLSILLKIIILILFIIASRVEFIEKHHLIKHFLDHFNILLQSFIHHFKTLF